MTLQQFNNPVWVKMLDTNEECIVGDFVFPYSAELQYLSVKTYIHGFTSFNTEKLRIKIYSDALRTKILKTSSWFALKGITNFNGNGFWLLPIPLDRMSINVNFTYYINIEVAGYVRNGATNYISVWLDTLDTDVNYNSNGAAIKNACLSMEGYLYA